MSFIDQLLNPTVKYTVGSKTPATTSGGIPVNVILSVDPDFKRTIYKTAGITAIGLALLGAGIALSKKR